MHENCVGGQREYTCVACVYVQTIANMYSIDSAKRYVLLQAPCDSGVKFGNRLAISPQW